MIYIDDDDNDDDDENDDDVDFEDDDDDDDDDEDDDGDNDDGDDDDDDVQVCQDVLDTLSRVDRGYTKWRGKMMSEVIRTTLVLAKEDYRRDGNVRRLEKAMLQKRWLVSI